MPTKKRDAIAFSKTLILFAVVLFGLSLPEGAAGAQQTGSSMPMQARYEDGAEYRWLHKKVDLVDAGPQRARYRKRCYRSIQS